MTEPVNISLTAADYATVHRLQTGLACTETLAWVLVRRGITDVDEARALLAAPDFDDPGHYGDPFLLGDMHAAVERIRFAIEDHQPIVVHGDYDADGVCSTTLLVETLESLGADVSAFLPSRFEHGYGVAIDTVEQLARSGARLLITVDCGITAVEALKHAADLGMDAIVLDHHQPGPELPPAIICSTRPSDYPEPDMCATVVAGKLTQALGAEYGDRAFELEAIATIADCMPLTGENRAIVQRGLSALRRTQRPGLRALMSACDTHPSDADEETIGFRIAPRLNAVGRLQHPDLAFELLRAPTTQIAESRAREVHEKNDERRRIEAEIVAQAEAQIASWSAAERARRIWVLCGEEWHEGVVGIVASRIVGAHGRPVIVLGQRGALATGSGRSIDGVNLYDALTDARDLLVRGGGHASAIGLTIDPSQLEPLRARLAHWGEQNITDAQLAPSFRADAVLAPDDLGIALVEELGRLAPFGTGNARPVLFVPAATVRGAQAIGADKTHLRCRFELSDGTSAPVIAFGQADLIPSIAQSARVDACVTVGMNRFRGAETLQLTAQTIRPIPEADADSVPGMCTTECNIVCSDRVDIVDVLRHLPERSGEAVVNEPALEPLLGRTDTVDLRHHGRANAHIVRLLTSGSSVMVVVNDVSRRRELLTTELAVHRLDLAAVTLASTRCDVGRAVERARSAHSRATDAAPHIIMADATHAAELFRASPEIADVVVVFDPPMTDTERDALAELPVPLHLTFGAAETRFVREGARAVLDIRGTLGHAWKPLMNGITSHTELDQLLWGHGLGSHLHSRAAVDHAVTELVGRGLIAVDAQAGIITANAAPAQPQTT